VPSGLGRAPRARPAVLARRLNHRNLLVGALAHRCQVSQLHRRRRDIHDIEFVRQRFDDDAHVVEVALGQPLPQRRRGELEAARPQVRHGRHRRHLDLLLVTCSIDAAGDARAAPPA
jgi:hypothetical protein